MMTSINSLVFLCILTSVCQLALTSKYTGITINSSCHFNFSQNEINRQYDMSSLSKQRVWQARVNSSLYVFVAMCGHFDATDADKCPDTQAAVCMAKQVDGSWTQHVPNAGRTMLVNSSTEGNNDFIINIIEGQLCKDSKNYSTTIFFTCNQAELLYIPTMQDECSLILFWSTTAACISNADAIDSCTLSLPNGRDSFDIRSLHQPQNYVVESTNGRKFELNFCLAGSGGTCVNRTVAACEVTNSTRQVIGDFSKRVLDYSPESGLKVIYKIVRNEKHVSRTEIDLTCNHTATSEMPVFLGEVDNVYKFEVETWTACVQWPVECVAYDREGNKYDLQALRKHSGNWEVAGETPGKKYFINVCAAVNLDNSYMMKGVGVAACVNSTECHSLGTLSTGPVKMSDGAVVLHYTGGSMCNGSSRYKTEISFVCALFENGPQFMSKSEECVFSFLWKSPSACPIKYAVGEQCIVKEPTYNTLFNLQPLYNKQQDYFIHLEKKGNFTLNVCGPLRKSCGGYTNASVCFKSGSKEIPIGWTSYEPRYTDGRVEFELYGAECTPGHPSTVRIILMCNYNPEAENATVNFVHADDQCTFYFVWHCREVCFPSKKVSCKATDSEGTVYDLSSLSLTSSNYVYLHRDSSGHSITFTINVCRSVVIGYGTVCSYHTAICLEDGTLPNKHNNLISIGEVSESPKFENGLLTLRYKSGNICQDQDGPPEKSSSIVFKCDPSAVETTPVLDKIEKCHYSFLWHTRAACPQRKPRKSDTEDGEEDGNCSAVNPVTNFRFDLSSLKKKNYTFKSQHGATFNVSICGGLSPDICGTGVGSCKINGGSRVALGKSNSKLLYDTALYLNYTNGDACLRNTSRRNTWIQFVCGPENSTSGPSFVEEVNDCTTIVAWNTELACERKVSCEVIVGDRLVNLAPLIGFSSNYEVPVQNYKFYINVCRPIVPVEGLNCLASSAACIANIHANGNLTGELSLGIPYLSPLAVDGGVVLKYLKGSPCLNNPGVYISSALYFVCDADAGEGKPNFRNLTGDCQYHFDWRTSIVCPPEKKTDFLNSNCTFLIEEKNMNVSLQPFADHATIVKANGEIFYVNPCMLKSSCNGIGVCRQVDGHNISYGQSVDFNHTKELTRLRFTNGSVCRTGMTYSSEIHFECDPHEQIGRPVVQSEEECSVVFSWKNSLTCVDGSADNVVSSSSYATAVGPVITGVLAGLAAVVAVLYFRKAANRKQFRRRFYSLFNSRQSHGCVSYSKCS